MNPLTPNEKQDLFAILKEQSETLDELKRGMYGDEPNGVKGLIDRTKHIEAWITASKRKVTFISGAVAFLVVAFKMGWEWVVEHAHEPRMP